MNKLIRMSQFEIVHGYKPKKHIDLIPMTHHLRVSEYASTFTSHVHNFYKEITRKFKKVMYIINFMLIYTSCILNLIRVIW